MTKPQLLIGAACVLVVTIAIVVVLPKPASSPTKTADTSAQVTVGQTTFDVIVANTPASQVKGLGETDHLDSHQGMYFPQDPGDNPTFWMKGMLIPIDIIWIKNNKVIGIDANAQPPADGQQQGDLTLYNSPEDFPNAILEIGANRAAEFGIQIGDAVEFHP